MRSNDIVDTKKSPADLLEQLKPSPTVNGDRHVQVKSPLNIPSLSQRALGSHGSSRHGSGTEN